MDLEYKDLRKSDYINEFSDVVPSRVPSGVVEVTSSSGDIYDELSTRDLITVLELTAKRLQSAEKEIASLRGQLEYIYKNGVDGYSTKIRTIRDRHPKPTE